jgi:uncharacterized protein (TIGR02266 family)
MSLYCPFCTKDIKIEMAQCPTCGKSFGTETRKFIRTLVEEMPREQPGERRKSARVHKTFKIVYRSPKAFVNHYLSDISTGGLFIKTGTPLDVGETFNLKLFLPNGGKELHVACEVVWIHTEGAETANGKHPSGMGVKFLHLSSEGQEKIRSVLSNSLH